MRFVTFAASILGAALVLGGCAASTDTEATSTEDSAEALSSLGKQLVGSYTRSILKGNGEEFEDIALDASGTYTADSADPSHGPNLTEAGTWSTSRGDLVLHPRKASAKRYSVVVASDGSGFKLTRNGVTEKFDRVVAPVTCADDSDCATGEECHFVSNCPSAPGTIHCMSGHNACVKVASAGESCGFRTQTATCARGLDCRHVVGTPLDALTCAPHLAAYGEPCGGFIANAAQCDDGLVCTHVDSSGHLVSHPDTPGVCRAAEGANCGGNMQGAHECAYPLHCQTTNPDVGGVCAQ